MVAKCPLELTDIISHNTLTPDKVKEYKIVSILVPSLKRLHGGLLYGEERT